MLTRQVLVYLQRDKNSVCHSGVQPTVFLEVALLLNLQNCGVSGVMYK